MMSSGKEETLGKILTRGERLPLPDGQKATRSEHVTAGSGVGSHAKVLGLVKPYRGSRKLSLMGQGIGFYCQLAKILIRVVERGAEARKELQSIVIHPASDHCFRLKQLKLRGPFRIRNLESPSSQFGFMLTSCQVTPLKDLLGMVIRDLCAART